jgi:hypothetical protein
VGFHHVAFPQEEVRSKCAGKTWPGYLGLAAQRKKMPMADITSWLIADGDGLMNCRTAKPPPTFTPGPSLVRAFYLPRVRIPRRVT